MTDPNELLSGKAAAEYLGTTENALAVRRKRGTGPVYLKAAGGKRIFYRREDIDAWLTRRTTTRDD